MLICPGCQMDIDADQETVIVEDIAYHDCCVAECPWCGKTVGMDIAVEIEDDHMHPECHEDWVRCGRRVPSKEELYGVPK